MKLSLVIPTYNERENISRLIAGLSEELKKHALDGEFIIVDDASPDGTGEVVDKLRATYSNLKVVHRSGKLGLSSAVLEGFKVAEGDVYGVMDADHSHPASKLGEMHKEIMNGADFVIGSRYVHGGRIENWGLYRKFSSKFATLLARVFTKVKDPMSGFFLIRRECIEGKELNPKGFKILLELLIKADYKNVVEVPITFTDRTMGASKAGFGEFVYYLRNLFGYLPYKRHIVTEFFKFAFVGGLGTIVNVSILYGLTERFGLHYLMSAVVAFAVAVTFNFFLNKVWTFRERLLYHILKEYALFVLVSLSALAVNLIFLYIFTEHLGIYYVVSQVLAIGLALIINFLGNKIWTFSR